MNPGLRFLLARWPVMLWRRIRRRFNGTRGLLSLVGIALLLALMVLPQFVASSRFSSPERVAANVEVIRAVAPLALLLFALAGAMRGGIFFRPAEIQFLFPAPIGRRELLLYDALSKFRLQVLSGLWVSIFTIRYAPHWYAAVIAVVLILTFLQLSGQTIGLLLAAIEERYGRRVRRFVFLTVWILIGAGVVPALLAGGGGGFLSVLATIVVWPPIAAMLWLTRPLVEIYVADSPAALLGWTGLTLGLFCLLIGLMLWLDVAYAESSLERAQKVQRALARMRSGGGAFAGAAPSRRGLRVPQLPYWRGVGPVAWRQLQEMARNYRGALMLGVMLLLFVGMFSILPRFVGPAGGPGRSPPPLTGIFMMVFMAPMLVTNSAFDFRRDLDRMALLKSYPISGFALCLGQIVPTALLITFWELIGVVVFTLWTGQVGTLWMSAIVLVAVPLNLVLIALDNLLFLKLPYRVVARDPGRVPFMPRLMLVMFLKMLLMLLLIGLTAVPVVVSVYLTEGNILVAAAVGALFLASLTVPMIHAVAWAFRSFDVSRDIPD